MIEFLGHKINNRTAEKPQLSNDYHFSDTPSVTNILGDHHFISDSMSSILTQISSASAVSKTMMRAIPELGDENTTGTSQNLSTIYETFERTFPLPVEHIQLEETQVNQSSVHEQQYKNNSMYNSGQQNSRLEISTELPPVLHLQKHPAAVSFPCGLSCIITPYPESLGISESTELSPLVNRSSTIDQNSMQKTEKRSSHEVTEVIVEGTKLRMADELEHKNSKNEDHRFTLTLSASLYGLSAPVSEKVKSKKLEDFYLVGKTENITDYADLQSRSGLERAYPMQYEICQRITTRNF